MQGIFLVTMLHLEVSALTIYLAIHIQSVSCMKSKISQEVLSRITSSLFIIQSNPRTVVLCCVCCVACLDHLLCIFSVESK